VPVPPIAARHRKWYYLLMDAEPSDQDAYAERRARMVQRQIADRGIHDPAVLSAMRVVPREQFVLGPYRRYAYDDTPLPIPANQTISQPYIVAYMIAALRLKPEDRVLEIGTGSGYAAAVLSRIVREVYSIERHNRLADYASSRLAHLGYDNVTVMNGDGTLGWPEHAPYDGIIVSAGGPAVPSTLRSQLAVGGRLVVPVGQSRRKQHLVLIMRTSESGFSEERLVAVAFVPLIGDEGWKGS
jgi:protein-L-isoaspartate(D-aspartate) O-methyltransferase